MIFAVQDEGWVASYLVSHNVKNKACFKLQYIEKLFYLHYYKKGCTVKLAGVDGSDVYRNQL